MQLIVFINASYGSSNRMASCSEVGAEGKTPIHSYCRGRKGKSCKLISSFGSDVISDQAT